MKRIALALWLLATAPAILEAQTDQINTDRLTVATAGAGPAVGTVRLGGLGTSGGTEFLFTDANRDVIRRAAAKADLPSAIAYEDEANTFTLGQTFSANATFTLDIAINGGDITSTGALTERATGNHTLDPTGDVILGPDGLDVLPATGYTYNLGALTNKYLTLHAAELWVETLVAQNTIATIGGRILVGPTTTLTSDLAAAATSMVVKHNQMVNGDRVYLEANGSLEWIAIASGPSGAGPYTYTVTRNLDGSGANNWTAGDAVFNTGTTGKGFIDLYSTSGVLSGSGPTIAFNARTGTTYNQIGTRGAVGNLNGLYGYAAERYGAAFGDPAGANITIDPIDGVRIRFSTTNKMQIDGSGNASFASGNATIDANGVRIAPSTSSDFELDNGYTFSTGDTLPAGLYARKAGGSNQAMGLVHWVTTSYTQALTSLESITGASGGYYATISATAGPSDAVNNYRANQHVFSATTWSGGLLTLTDRFAISASNSATDPGYPWIRSTGADLAINPTGANGVYLSWDAGSVVYLGANTYTRGHLRPSANNTYQLGDASNKWTEIYFMEPTTGTALFPLVSSSGRIMAKNDGLNGVTTCAGAQRVSSITFEFGIATAIVCS